MRVKKSKAVEQNDTSSRARALFTPSVPRGRPGATQLHAHYKHPPAFWRRRRGNRREDAKVSLAAWPMHGGAGRPTDRCNKGLDGRRDGRPRPHGAGGLQSADLDSDREGWRRREESALVHTRTAHRRHTREERRRKKEGAKKGREGQRAFLCARLLVE